MIFEFMRYVYKRDELGITPKRPAPRLCRFARQTGRDGEHEMLVGAGPLPFRALDGDPNL